MLAHHAESSFGKTVEEYSQQENRLKEAKEDLRLCREERDSLKQNLQKWGTNKEQLESKVVSLGEDNKKLVVSLETAEADLRKSREELEKAREELKKAQTAVSKSEEVKDLTKEVDELKSGVVLEFDRGFDTALAHLNVFYPEADVSKFDLDKIIIDGRVVD